MSRAYKFALDGEFACKACLARWDNSGHLVDGLRCFAVDEKADLYQGSCGLEDWETDRELSSKELKAEHIAVVKAEGAAAPNITFSTSVKTLEQSMLESDCDAMARFIVKAQAGAVISDELYAQVKEAITRAGHDLSEDGWWDLSYQEDRERIEEIWTEELVLPAPFELDRAEMFLHIIQGKITALSMMSGGSYNDISLPDVSDHLELEYDCLNKKAELTKEAIELWKYLPENRDEEIFNDPV